RRGAGDGRAADREARRQAARGPGVRRRAATCRQGLAVGSTDLSSGQGGCGHAQRRDARIRVTATAAAQKQQRRTHARDLCKLSDPHSSQDVLLVWAGQKARSRVRLAMSAILARPPSPAPAKSGALSGHADIMQNCFRAPVYLTSIDTARAALRKSSSYVRRSVVAT